MFAISLANVSTLKSAIEVRSDVGPSRQIPRQRFEMARQRVADRKGPLASMNAVSSSSCTGVPSALAGSFFERDQEVDDAEGVERS